MGEDPRRSKASLRRQTLARRAELGEEGRDAASARICDSLSRLAELSQASIVAAFSPMAEEVDIRRIAKEAINQRRTLCLPRVVARGAPLSMHKIADPDAELTTGYGGVMEPSLDLPRIPLAEITAALVPSACIDREGNRLGYGLGFYDITLAAMPNALLIAPIFHCQLTEPRLPCVEPHDHPVDIIVTERETLDLRR